MALPMSSHAPLLLSGMSSDGTRLVDCTVTTMDDFQAFMAESPQAFVAEIQDGDIRRSRVRTDFVKLFIQSSATKNCLRSFIVPRRRDKAIMLYDEVYTFAVSSNRTVWVEEALASNDLDKEVERFLELILEASPSHSRSSSKLVQRFATNCCGKRRGLNRLRSISFWVYLKRRRILVKQRQGCAGSGRFSG